MGSAASTKYCPHSQAITEPGGKTSARTNWRVTHVPATFRHKAKFWLLPRAIKRHSRRGDSLLTRAPSAGCNSSSVSGHHVANSSPLSRDIDAEKGETSSSHHQLCEAQEHGRARQSEYEDEEDWIQVEEADDVLQDTQVSPQSISSARVLKQTHGLSLTVSAEQSYYFTQSGAFNVNGVDGTIRDSGLEYHRSPAAATTPGVKHFTSDTAKQIQRAQFSPVSAHPRKSPIPLQDRVVILEQLGEGASGRVHKAFDLQRLQLVAIKSIPIADRSKRHQMTKELRTLCQHLADSSIHETHDGASNLIAAGRFNVVSFYDAFSSQCDATVSLMVEYMDGGSLQTIVKAGGTDDEHFLASLAFQASQGLCYLHGINHLHRDLKPANMLTNRAGVLKLSDFGIVRRLELDDISRDQVSSTPLIETEPILRSESLQFSPASFTTSLLETSIEDRRTSWIQSQCVDHHSRLWLPLECIHLQVSPNAHCPSYAATYDTSPEDRGRTPDASSHAADQTNVLAPVHSFIGTAVYMSPERISGDSYSVSADIWSLGLSFFAIAVGYVPFRQTQGYWSLLKSIRDEPVPILPDTNTRGHKWSPEFRDFLLRCLDKNPDLRPPASQLCSHPFLRQAQPVTAGIQRPVAQSRNEISKIMRACVSHIENLMARGAQLPGASLIGASANEVVANLLGIAADSSCHTSPQLAKIATQLGLPLAEVESCGRELLLSRQVQIDSSS